MPPTEQRKPDKRRALLIFLLGYLFVLAGLLLILHSLELI